MGLWFETYKITKPVRLIELFAGIGAQAKALENLGVNFEHWKICEFDKYPVCSYNAIHHTNFLPSDITKIHAEDLEIKDTDKYEYILTYSYPCTSISLAGKREGMIEGSGTASSLLWEVKRLLEECSERGSLPQILLMENVPQVLSIANRGEFERWYNFLVSLGYSSKYKILNSKDFGIPQNRRRCYMVSILGDYEYEFPEGFPLKLTLKDMLERNVDKKYFLSANKIKSIANWKAQQDPLKDIDKEKKISPTLTARGAGEEHSGMVLINEDVEFLDSIPIKEATKKGYSLARDGDGVYTNRVDVKRGTVQKGMIQTLKTSCDDIGVVVKDELIKVGELTGGKWDKINESCRRVYDPDGIAPTLTTCGGGNQEIKICQKVSDIGVSPTTTARPEEFKTTILPVVKDEKKVYTCASRGRDPENPNNRSSSAKLQQRIEVGSSEVSNTITTVQKDSLLLEEYLGTFDYTSILVVILLLEIILGNNLVQSVYQH